MIIDDVPTHFTNKHAVSMTLRDYFAAKAMQAMLENSECPLAPLTEIPQACYKMADAMLKAREA
jgi:hypothetical protein